MSKGGSITDSIKGILMNGINLNLDSPEEEEHYVSKLIEYFENETEFTAYLKKDNVMEIETKDFQSAMEVYVVNSTLFMLPMMNDIFEIFTEILKFISYHHLAVVSEFRGIEEIKIENIKDLRKNTKEVEKENVKEIEQEEPSSDDDYEWI